MNKEIRRVRDIQERLHAAHAASPEDVQFLLDLFAQSNNNPAKLEPWSFLGRLWTTVNADTQHDTFTRTHISNAMCAHGVPAKVVVAIMNASVDDVPALTKKYRFFVSRRTIKLVRIAVEYADDSVGFSAASVLVWLQQAKFELQ